MKIACFGEVLWDIFPDHKKIGGAPLNVALRLKSLGIDICLITRIGKDQPGKELLDYIQRQGLSSHAFQIDPHYKTGEVLVTLDKDNTATYEISYPAAWDFIEYSEYLTKEIQESDAIVFGSLICRNKVSRNTLLQVLDIARFKVLDVNLRTPYYDIESLLLLMNKADFIKFNAEELDEICIALNIQTKTTEDQVIAIASKTNTSQICITKGKHGATLFYQNLFYSSKGYKVKVVDTVGAGDSFLGALINELLMGRQPQESIDYACAIGAMVASSKGANPVFTNDQVIKLMKQM
ncbi:carbohydrate kinase family protein [Aquimarina sediminis]|uniref:carbohydrate kinase family protein n=1 Tax=Aquimarina sediminis TaxID=2070536 RepID=UPI000CA00272|nr:carbohydrate kinase [Aquimarina sediminis]